VKRAKCSDSSCCGEVVGAQESAESVGSLDHEGPVSISLAHS
jgi:hypothetical protein